MNKILVIEPDKYAAELYVGALKTLGHKVELVNGAQKALDSLDKKLPDVIVLEIDLPNHNGLEFLYEFSSYYDWKHIPIIIHTVISPDKFSIMINSWRDYNVIDYLYKPKTSLQSLQEAVSHNFTGIFDEQT